MLGHVTVAVSTVGGWLREFTFGHVRQLDRVAELVLTRAWAVGAGPDDADQSTDFDSTICEVHGYAQQGTGYGYTRVNGYHPLIAPLADTAGSTPGFWSHEVMKACIDHGADFSITVRNMPSILTRIAAIDEDSWVDIDYIDGGDAPGPETVLGDHRLVVRRTRITNDPDLPQLFASWRHHASSPAGPATRRPRRRSPRPRRRGTGHPRPRARRGTGPLPLGRVQRHAA